MNITLKTVAVALATLCVASHAEAQPNDVPTKPFRIGIEAGLSINNYTGTDRYWREGFYAGAHGEWQLQTCFLSASLRLVRKGADAFTGDSDSDDYYEAYYVELPVAIGLRGRLGRRATAFVETGPYFAVGIGGKAKGESYAYANEHGMVTYKWDNRFFSSANDSPRRFDVGWGVRGGVSFSHIGVVAGYEIGLMPVWDVSHVAYGGEDHHNTSFTLGLTYMF